MSEDWRAVPGWEGAYEVSSAGRVRSVTRTVVAGRPVGGVGPRTYQGRVLRAGLTANGYAQVSLTAPGRPRYYAYVHDLVAAAFIGSKPAGLEVCHRNGTSHDNRAGNLRYGTRSSNQLDRHAHGSRWLVGEECGTAKLTAEAVRHIRRSPLSFRALGRLYGVCHKTIAAAARGESWAHVQGGANG